MGYLHFYLRINVVKILTGHIKTIVLAGRERIDFAGILTWSRLASQTSHEGNNCSAAPGQLIGVRTVRAGQPACCPLRLAGGEGCLGAEGVSLEGGQHV